MYWNHLAAAIRGIHCSPAQSALRPPQRPLAVAAPAVPPISWSWPLTDTAGNAAGHVSSITWSPDFEINVAIGMVHKDHWTAGTTLHVQTPDGPRDAEVRDSFWIRIADDSG